MWFLNKETGLKWEISDENTIKVLSKDEKFEEVPETDDEKKSTKPKK